MREAKKISDVEALATCSDMLDNAEKRIVKTELSLSASRDSTKAANRKIIIRTVEGTLLGLAVGYVIGKF